MRKSIMYERLSISLSGPMRVKIEEITDREEIANSEFIRRCVSNELARLESKKEK